VYDAAAMACELPHLIQLSVAVYPVITFGVVSASKVENFDMPILPAVMMEWFSNRYFTTSRDLMNPLVCPLLRSKEELAKVPRTHVITAQYDVLRDEGIAYVSALRSAGVCVTHKNYDNTVHGFFGNASITHGTEALLDAAQVIREHFSL
jgi:acetyl esterase